MTGKPPVVRSAVAGDILELKRLFYAMMAEAGVDDFSISKVQQTLERGIKRDGAMLLVACGKSGRLVGFLLFELIAPWFSDTRQTTETCIFVEPGHRRSIGARELRKFAAWHRTEGAGRKIEVVAPASKPPASVQNGSRAVPQPVVDDSAIATDSLEGVLRMLGSCVPKPPAVPAS
jgi:hypothetical protein